MKAVKTLDAIKEAIEKDQGAKYRGLLKKYMPLAGDAYDDKEEDGLRNHLGASILGRECARYAWYSFRWATKPIHDARLLRLFNRGHLEEMRIAALLELIGCDVWLADANGDQFRIDLYDKHAGGSLDSVVKGIPDIPDEPMLAEYKTHNTKSFCNLVNKGLLDTKFEHYVQMQLYMGKYNLKFAIYFSVNKNDDDLYAEIIEFDQDTFERYQERAIMVVQSKEPPPKISQTPGWYQCKWCDHKPVCHNKPLPLKTCRSCTKVKIGPAGTWICTVANQAIPKEVQKVGCGQYESDPVFKNKV